LIILIFSRGVWLITLVPSPRCNISRRSSRYTVRYFRVITRCFSIVYSMKSLFALWYLKYCLDNTFWRASVKVICTKSRSSQIERTGTYLRISVDFMKKVEQFLKLIDSRVRRSHWTIKFNSYEVINLVLHCQKDHLYIFKFLRIFLEDYFKYVQCLL